MVLNEPRTLHMLIGVALVLILLKVPLCCRQYHSISVAHMCFIHVASTYNICN